MHSGQEWQFRHGPPSVPPPPWLSALPSQRRCSAVGATAATRKAAVFAIRGATSPVRVKMGPSPNETNRLPLGGRMAQGSMHV
jgi:hypothetical protein